MANKTIELLMSNVNQTPVDLLHQVTCHQGEVWENPYKQAKSIVDQNNNYKKYTHFLANVLYLGVSYHKAAYEKLLHRAIQTEKLVFECTCYPGPCHLDALRIRLAEDLRSKGFIITSNQVDDFKRQQEDDDS